MECGECTMCCEVLHIKEIKKPANVLCTFCDKGCTIHNKKPDSCKEFECMYYQMKKVNIAMRPDKCGVMFEKLEDDLIIGTVDSKHKDFKFVNGQITAFLKEGINVVVSKNGIPVVYHLDNVLPEEVLRRIYLINKRNNGSSSI